MQNDVLHYLNMNVLAEVNCYYWYSIKIISVPSANDGIINELFICYYYYCLLQYYSPLVAMKFQELHSKLVCYIVLLH